MTSNGDRYARIHAILSEARGLSGQELETYLDGACGADTVLRSEVLDLLLVGHASWGKATKRLQLLLCVNQIQAGSS